jgi:hypothetical protein
MGELAVRHLLRYPHAGLLAPLVFVGRTALGVFSTVTCWTCSA